MTGSSLICVGPPSVTYVLDGKYCDWTPALSVVPAGYTLGPLLLVCCVAELPNNINIGFWLTLMV